MDQQNAAAPAPAESATALPDDAVALAAILGDLFDSATQLGPDEMAVMIAAMVAEFSGSTAALIIRVSREVALLRYAAQHGLAFIDWMVDDPTETHHDPVSRMREVAEADLSWTPALLTLADVRTHLADPEVQDRIVKESGHTPDWVSRVIREDLPVAWASYWSAVLSAYVMWENATITEEYRTILRWADGIHEETPEVVPNTRYRNEQFSMHYNMGVPKGTARSLATVQHRTVLHGPWSDLVTP